MISHAYRMLMTVMNVTGAGSGNIDIEISRYLYASRSAHRDRFSVNVSLFMHPRHPGHPFGTRLTT